MYQFGLIGLGAANALLLIRLEQENRLEELFGVVFDSSEKSVNDKTYCFWAAPKDSIVQDLRTEIKHSWSTIDSNDQHEVLAGMRYYMVESLSLYQRARAIIDNHEGLVWVKESVTHVVDEDVYVEIQTESTAYQVQRVYDSRPPQINEVIGKTVWQSFQGWKVRFEKSVFQPDTMRLMDFNIPQNDFTQFMYVLPTSEREALVEFTRFGTEMIPEELATHQLRNYMLPYQAKYEIEEVERGSIPMSQNAEQHHHSPKIISTGSRAGKLKATTGYAFKNMFNHAKALVTEDELNKVENPWYAIPSRGGGRFAFYDFLLLFILKVKPHWGKSIFTRLFRVKPYEEVFTFLDEKSTLGWELGMFARLNKRKFIWSAIFSSLAYMLAKPQRWLPFVFSGFALLLNAVAPGFGTNWGIGILIFFLFIIGIPHGALDGFSHNTKLKLPAFIARYLGIMALVILLWLISPFLGLISFLIYSAWHFGETDLMEWNRSNILLSFLWGIILLGIILLSHLTEVNQVMKQMNISPWPILTTTATSLVQLLFFLAALGALWFRSGAWVLALFSLAIGTQLPLVLSFGVYFVLQHSITGWSHLKEKEGWSHSGMFIKALPFTAGAIVIFLILFQFDRTSLMSWSSYFLIFLSALSLPHIYFMSRLYKSA